MKNINLCPLCGSAQLFSTKRMAKDIFELIEEKGGAQNFILDSLRLLESLLDEDKIKEEIEVMAEEAFTAKFLSLVDTLGNSVKLTIEENDFGLSFNYSWIYVKVWHERGWVALKSGKTKDFEKREKQYDDHDYVLNLYTPVPNFTLNEYEEFLQDHITSRLIPYVLSLKEKRLKKVLREDFENVELKDGVAPSRKEYWRLYISTGSDEYEFMLSNLITFFSAFAKPGWPITYNEWIVLKKRMDNANSQYKGEQLSLLGRED